MTKFLYHNDLEILNENRFLLETVEIEADSEEEANNIYRGYDGSRAENTLRDYHVN